MASWSQLDAGNWRTAKFMKSGSDELRVTSSGKRVPVTDLLITRHRIFHSISR
jgi:hypothetical protein